eukprot:XP_004914524.1 PREDICTED: uncharacterized protein LOC100487960 isoform X2 [Xenopus tropicalis]
MEEQVGATRSLQPTGVGLATNTEAGSGGTAPQASGNRSTVGVEGALTGQDAGCSPSQFFSPQGNRNTTDNGAGQRAPGQSSQGAAQPVGQVSAAGPGSGSPGRILPRPGVAAHLTGMLDWVQRSVAPNTWARYRRIWGEWLLMEAGAGEVASDSARLGLLVWRLSQDLEANISTSSLEKKLAAWAFLFKLRGWRDFTKEFVIKQAVKGFKKGRRSADRRRPITLDILEGLFDQLQVITHTAYELALFQLAFSWAFYGAFRISELVSENRQGKGGIQAEDVGDIGEGLSIVIRGSKTDKEGEGLTVPLFGVAGCRTCPVRCNREYRQVRPAGRGTYLVHQDRSSLSRFQFIAVLKRALNGLGLAEKEYGSHSFRIGAATEAARWGLSTRVVQRIGRWESNRFKSYIRPTRVEFIAHRQ